MKVFLIRKKVWNRKRSWKEKVLDNIWEISKTFLGIGSDVEEIFTYFVPLSTSHHCTYFQEGA